MRSGYRKTGLCKILPVLALAGYAYTQEAATQPADGPLPLPEIDTAPNTELLTARPETALPEPAPALPQDTPADTAEIPAVTGNSTDMPLPAQALGEQPAMPTLAEITGIQSLAGMPQGPTIPENLAVESDGSEITYNATEQSVEYDAKGKPIHIAADSGAEIYAYGMTARMQDTTAELRGPVTMYQRETMMRSSSATYDWGTGQATMQGVRAKVNGMLVRGSHIEYGKDRAGRNVITIHDAYVTTEDIEHPHNWIGTGTLRIVPGDYGSLSRLSVAGRTHDMAVPILGWIPFSHSLNPKEGYMPGLGTRSYWGAYLFNSYGILFGNRRVEGIMPTADYLATLHADYRSRRGLATGLDLKDLAMSRRNSAMTGIHLYGLDDNDPTISPTDARRESMHSKRYRAAMQAEWDLPVLSNKRAEWKAAVNVNVVSDRYMLRDYFLTDVHTTDKPDNTVRLTRTSGQTLGMLYTRFAPNDYYATDRRVELSFYRVRTPIGSSRLNYETRSSAGYMSQYLSPEQRTAYRHTLQEMKDSPERDYYARLLNTEAFFRVNTTHELTTDFKFMRFLNVTPKAGFGYTGYYDVGGIGADNRFMGFLGCDMNFRLQRHYTGFSYPRLGMKGLTHTVRPYASFTQTAISSSNELVPRIDHWSTTMGSSVANPMPMDLSSFTGIDGWGKLAVWRFGMQNTLSSLVDGERVKVLDWNAYMDYNADNPNTERPFSNLYSLVQFSPGEHISVRFESQTPTFRGGEEFQQYNTSVSHLPCAWLEYTFGHRYITDHPIQQDSNQLYAQANLRINQNYTLSGRAYFDITEGTCPYQQLSVFRNAGAWFVGVNMFLRDNGGKKEMGLGLSFTLGETGTSLPVNLY